MIFKTLCNMLVRHLHANSNPASTSSLKDVLSYIICFSSAQFLLSNIKLTLSRKHSEFNGCTGGNLRLSLFPKYALTCIVFQNLACFFLPFLSLTVDTPTWHNYWGATIRKSGRLQEMEKKQEGGLELKEIAVLKCTANVWNVMC